MSWLRESHLVKTKGACRPFLRWAGGKSRIVRYLLELLPNEGFGDYWEPFLGSGALFFALAPERAHLSDLNADLIGCYEQIRDRPGLVFRYLREHLSKTSEAHYYRVRTVYNRSNLLTHRRSAAQAGRFIYLNRAGFNGIFRVNRKGEYNVPYGHKEPAPAPSCEDLGAASNLLIGTSLWEGSYDSVLARHQPQPGDLVYLDPPYPPLNATSQFTHYTASRFSWEDQEKVSALASRLRSRGCLVIISNTDTRAIRELYSGWEMRTLPVTRWIAANGSRHNVADLIITSYQTECERRNRRESNRSIEGKRI